MRQPDEWLQRSSSQSKRQTAVTDFYYRGSGFFMLAKA